MAYYALTASCTTQLTRLVLCPLRFCHILKASSYVLCRLRQRRRRQRPAAQSTWRSCTCEWMRGSDGWRGRKSRWPPKSPRPPPRPPRSATATCRPPPRCARRSSISGKHRCLHPGIYLRAQTARCTPLHAVSRTPIEVPRQWRLLFLQHEQRRRIPIRMPGIGYTVWRPYLLLRQLDAAGWWLPRCPPLLQYDRNHVFRGLSPWDATGY